jgi:lipoprotein signal peptidase
MAEVVKPVLDQLSNYIIVDIGKIIHQNIIVLDQLSKYIIVNIGMIIQQNTVPLFWTSSVTTSLSILVRSFIRIQYCTIVLDQLSNYIIIDIGKIIHQNIIVLD